MAVERGEKLVRRYRLVAGLRLVCALSLLVLAATFFRQPLRAVLGPRLAPMTGAIFQPQAASGFMLRISSQPTGAEVHVNGAPRGSTTRPSGPGG